MIPEFILALAVGFLVAWSHQTWVDGAVFLGLWLMVWTSFDVLERFIAKRR